MSRKIAVSLPSLICITGVDGSGKTSLTEWLLDELKSRGYHVESIWSRFNNFLSRPMLALTRLTGHNRREKIEGTEYGFHDFEKLYGYRELFAILQGVDTNIAAYFKVTRKKRHYDSLICERSACDTMVDVISDTGIHDFVEKYLSWLYLFQFRMNAKMLLIDREYEKIIVSRPELKHDYKMKKKITCYRRVAGKKGWVVIDNNHSLDDSRQQILAALGLENE